MSREDSSEVGEPYAGLDEDEDLPVEQIVGIVICAIVGAGVALYAWLFA